MIRSTTIPSRNYTRVTYTTLFRSGHFLRDCLFTSYHRQCDEFGAGAVAQVGQGRYTALADAAGLYVDQPGVNASALVADSAWRRHQMPAYHLIAPDGVGITLVNIGVGPAKDKTICDHLAVLRPQAWPMNGHCGGLPPRQRSGAVASYSGVEGKRGSVGVVHG